MARHRPSAIAPAIRACRFIAACALAAAGAVAGCAGDASRPAPVTRLTADDFAGNGLLNATAAPAPPGSQPPLRPAPAPTVISRAEAMGVPAADSRAGRAASLHGERSRGGLPPGETLSVSVKAGAPAIPAERPPGVGDPVLIDAVVGDINGKPFYAHTFIDRLGPRVQSMARELQRGVPGFAEGRADPAAVAAARKQWRSQAAAIVLHDVKQSIADELFRAKGLAKLNTPERKQGLTAYIQSQTNQRIRQAGGIREAAERSLPPGQTEEEWAQQTQDKALAESVVMDLYSRIYKPWQETRLYFERHRDEFHPPPVARLRQIKIEVSNNADKIEEIRAALASGEDFEAVARRPVNYFNRDRGGLVEVPVPRGYEPAHDQQVEFFPDDPPLNRAIAALRPTQFTPEPIISRGYAKWVRLEEIKDRSRSLSEPDVQIEIEGRLYGETQQREINNEVNRLMNNARIRPEQVDGITDRLVEILADRYWPQTTR